MKYIKHAFSIIIFLLLVFSYGCGITVTSDPTGANVYKRTHEFSDNPEPCGDMAHPRYYIGKTPLSFTLVFNVMKVLVTKEGYDSHCSSGIGLFESFHAKLKKKKVKTNFVEKILSEPSEAEVFYGKDRNALSSTGERTPYTKQTYDYSLEGSCYQLKKYGYEDSEIVCHSITKEKERVINVRLKERSKRTIHEIINSKPSGAKIYWGDSKGNLVYSGHKTPYEMSIIEKYPKIHSKYYQVQLNGYFDSDIIHYPESEKTRTVNFELIKDAPAIIKITAEQQGVKVYINNKYWGEANNNELFKKLKRGAYVIKAEKNGYRTQEYTLVAEVGGNYSKHFNLKKIAFGNIKLLSNQQDVNIYINDKFQGKITEKPFVKKLPVGKHIVTAKKDYYGTKSIQMTIEEFDAIAYKFVLEESGNMHEKIGSGKIVQSTGTLVVLTSRNDLSMIIDGQEKGLPVKLEDMASGKYKVNIKGDGIDLPFEFIVTGKDRSVYDLDELIKP